MTKKLSDQELVDLFNQNLPPVDMPPGLSEGIQQRVLAEVDATLKPLSIDYSDTADLPASSDDRTPDRRATRAGAPGATTGLLDRLARRLSGLRLGTSLAFATATAAILLVAVILLPSLLREMTTPEAAQTGVRPTVLPTTLADVAPAQGTMIVSGGAVSIRTAAGVMQRYDGAMRVTFAAGDTIITESGGATLRYFNQQSTLLQPGTEVEVVSLASAGGGTEVVLFVARGHTFHVVEKELTTRDVFEVRTDLLTARVTGTEFEVNVRSEDEAAVIVDTGEVLLTTRDGRWEYVQADHMAVVSVDVPLTVNRIVDQSPAVAANSTPTPTPTAMATATAPPESTPAPTATADPADRPTAKPTATPFSDALEPAAGATRFQPDESNPALLSDPGNTPAAASSGPDATSTPARPASGPTSGSGSAPAATATPTDGASVFTAAQASTTRTPTASPTATPVPTRTGTATPRPTATLQTTTAPTSTATRPTATALPTSTPTATPAATVTATRTPTARPTVTPRPTATDTPAPTATATSAPTNTPLPTATNTPLPTATATSTPVDLAPVVQSEAGLTVDEDTSKTIPVLVNDRDPEGKALRLVGVTDPPSGTAAINAANGTVTYTPDADYVGPDSFTYTVSDGVQTATGTVSLQVNPVNDAPSFSPEGRSVTVEEDSGETVIPGWASAITAGPTDEADQVLTFIIEIGDVESTGQGASDGGPLLAGAPTLDPATGDLRISVVPDAFGSVVLAVRLSDGELESEPRSLEVIVTPVNDMPSFGLLTTEITVAEDSGAQSLALVEALDPGAENESDQVLRFDVTATPADLFAVPPQIDLATGHLQFTPAPDAAGTAQVTLELADDAGGRSESRTVTIVITSINDPPSAGADSFALDEDMVHRASLFAPNGGAADLDPEGSDLRVVRLLGDPAAVGVERQLSSGARILVDAAGNMTYTAASYLNGLGAGDEVTDRFTYTIADDDGETAQGEVTVVVSGRNDAPRATDDSLRHVAAGTLVANVMADNGAGRDWDPDAGDTMVVASVNTGGQAVAVPFANGPLVLPSGARLSVQPDGSIAYQPGEAFLAGGTDTFTYTLRDGAASTSNEATVTIVLDPVQN